jgi:hypothetical protein
MTVYQTTKSQITIFLCLCDLLVSTIKNDRKLAAFYTGMFTTYTNYDFTATPPKISIVYRLQIVFCNAPDSVLERVPKEFEGIAISVTNKKNHTVAIIPIVDINPIIWKGRVGLKIDPAEHFLRFEGNMDDTHTLQTKGTRAIFTCTEMLSDNPIRHAVGTFGKISLDPKVTEVEVAIVYRKKAG